MSQTPRFPKVKTAIALLTYNSAHLLKDLLPKVIEHTPSTEDYAIFVIDNASTDATAQLLQQFAHQVQIITLSVNKGFTNGYKLGLAQIDADYYCLLSSDVEVSPGYVEPVVDMFDQDAMLAVVQPKIKSWHRRDEFEYAGACGGFIDYQGYPFCRGRIFYTVEKDQGQYQQPMEIFWASGACFFIRAKLYHNSGGLDDDFYAHMEEIDLCWRLKNQGYKVMVCPQSEVYHMGGAVIAYGSPAKVYRNHRNNLIMMMKNLPQNEVMGKILLRLFMDALAFVNMILRGQIKSSFYIISAHWNFFANLGHWRKKRKDIQSKIVHHTKSGIYPNSIVKEYFLKKHFTFSKLTGVDRLFPKD